MANVHNDSYKVLALGILVTKAKHKKVRFDKNVDRHLRSMPSHNDGRGPVDGPKRIVRKGAGKRLAAFAGLATFAVLIAIIAFVASGNLLPILRGQAETALQRAIPPNMNVKLGETDVSFLWPPKIGITYSDIELTNEQGNEPIRLSELTLGVDPFSLMDGQPKFDSISADKLTFAFPAGQEGQMPHLRIADVQSAFDVVTARLLTIGSQHFYQPGGVNIQLTDISLALPENGYSAFIDLPQLNIAAQNGRAEIAGEMLVDGYRVPLTGSINLANETDETQQPQSAEVAVQLKSMPMPWRRLQTIVSNVDADHVPEARPAPLLADLTLTGANFGGAGSDSLELSVKPIDMAFKLAADDYVPVGGQFRIAMDFATPAITIRPDQWSLGRSDFLLNGRIRDSANTDQRNAFDFEVLANRGRISAADAPTGPVRFAARAQGIAFLDEGIIDYKKLEIDSDAGTALGQGDITLKGDFQTAVFEVLVEDMSIAGVKQFWPAPIARAARRWVLNNLAGGRVTTGRFDIAEPLRRRIPGTDKYLTGNTKVELAVEGVRFDVAGEIPPVRDADGSVRFDEGVTVVSLERGTVFMPTGRTAEAKDGVLTIFPADETDGKIRASLDLGVSGDAKAVGELITFKPIDATRFYDFNAADLSGSVEGRVNLDFLLNGGAEGPRPDWSVDFVVSNAGSAANIEGRKLDNLDGRIKVDPRRAEFDLEGNIDDLPAQITMVIPFGDSGVAAKRDIRLTLSTNERRKIAPGLETILTGTTPVRVESAAQKVSIDADLTAAELSLPWIGWAKGSGIKSDATFDLLQNGGLTSLRNFKLSGSSFGLNNGSIDVDGRGVKSAKFGFAQLSKDDNFSLNINRRGEGYEIAINGKSMDGRAMMRHVRTQARKTSGSAGSVPIDMTAKIGRLQGFHGEHLNNVDMSLRVRGGTVTRFKLTGSTKDGFPVFLDLEGAGSGRNIRVESLGAGAFLRFADIYTNVRGGTLNVSLRGSGPQSMSGKADLFDFRVFNEPKLAQLVSSRAGNSQSLEQAVNRQIDTREVKFERATSDLVFKPGRLDIAQAVARGPLAGFTIQGKVFDANNQTRLTGTFLPAYGLNRLFGEIPILGAILGNGRDRGLIGVTFMLSGSFDSPDVTVNPLSVIAPGIFRSIFEFR